MAVLEPKIWREIKNYLDMPGSNVILMACTSWCGPCKHYFPIFQEVSEELSSRFVAMKVNLDECPDINDMLGVGSVPTFIYLKRGKEVYRSIGGCQKEDFVFNIDKYFFREQ